jgi:hypothetical protein
MCTKRVFTKNDLNINYKDYNTIKSGNEILKSIKTEDSNAILSKFMNYNSWQTLSASYFKNFDSNDIEVSYVKSLYDADESFIDEKCDPTINKTSCSSEKNTLYPYGNILSKKKIAPYFPSNIYLCKWCNKNKINKTNLYLYSKNKNLNEISICEEKEPVCSCDCKNTKKRKPLFI